MTRLGHLGGFVVLERLSTLLRKTQVAVARPGALRLRRALRRDREDEEAIALALLLVEDR